MPQFSNDSFSVDADPNGQPQSPGEVGLSRVLERNIRTFQKRHEEETARAGFEERIARAITRFTGSMPFVYLHALVFGFWIIANVGWIPGVPRWDPSFVILAMLASVEAIFLSTFVLIAQNRMAATAERRANLDLQINLLAEHEITKLIALVSAIATKTGAKAETEPEIEELTQDIQPEAVLDELEAEIKANEELR